MSVPFISLDLPFPPSTNAIWSRTKTGMRKSDKYKSWLTQAGWEARRQAKGMVAGPYGLTIKVVRPDARKRDLDNVIKATSDLLVGLGMVEDDYLCVHLEALWVPVGPPLHVMVIAGKGEV